MGTNCAPLLANLYLHIYEFEFLKQFLQTNSNKDSNQQITTKKQKKNPEQERRERLKFAKKFKET